ncbi:MAG: calcium/sodium antiporter, partial [Planctomycetes bacterium]|nr:calcium/sodium antiporter [Planctomycetota bacterium]
GQADMAVGNVVGSNIFNVLAIVGLAAAITPLLVAVQLVRRDVPVMIVVSLVLIGLALDGRIGRLDGVLLFGTLVGYTTWIVRASRREGAAAAAAMDTKASAPRGNLSLDLGFVLGGCAMLVLGSTWMVDGAIAFAKWLGLSEVVVGLTIVAAGTSLPELATSVMAAAKGERDIAVGNVVGSNVFNILGVLGLSGIMAPDGLTVLPSMITLDLPVMLAAAFACLPFFARGHVIPRWEGVLFLLFYVAYTTWLVMDATQHEAREGYASIMLRLVLPLTAVTLALVAWRVLRLPRD